MVRDLTTDDYPSLIRVHDATGFNYEFPDLSDPLFCVKKGVEEDGKLTQGIALKLETTAYLWMDPDSGNKVHRLLKFKELVAAVRRAAWEKGLDTITCVIPPEIAEEFREVLESVGMLADRPWPKYSLDISGDSYDEDHN